MLATVDVTAGVRLALDVLSEDKSPMVLPLPAYSPQLGLAEVTNRPQWDLPVTPDGDEYVLDLDHLDRLFADGARTLLLTNPHNPCSHVHTRAELEGIRDLALKHGARVVSDEIHAPLVLPGATHIPYLALEGTAEHAVAVVAASKAFNTAGLKCAQVVTADRATLDRLAGVPMARNDSWSSLGVVAAIAAYRDGDAWLAALVERLTELRTLLADLLAEHLPEARMRPLEATYLAWLDLRAYGHDDPAAVASKGGVRVYAGHDYHPGADRTRPAQPRHVARAADRDRQPDGGSARLRNCRVRSSRGSTSTSAGDPARGSGPRPGSRRSWRPRARRPSRGSRPAWSSPLRPGRGRFSTSPTSSGSRAAVISSSSSRSGSVHSARTRAARCC